MGETCGCCGHDHQSKPVRYQCDCDDDCSCSILEFDAIPDQIPHCCGKPMKRAD